jgi:hypothetical protein
MNRDESVRRVAANSPEVSYRDGHALLYPAEPSGGTWIGVNDTGFSLALINWHAVSSHPERPVVCPTNLQYKKNVPKCVEQLGTNRRLVA